MDLFHPLVLESTCAFGPVTKDRTWAFIKEALGAKDRELDPEYETVRTYVLMSRLSTICWNDIGCRYLKLLSTCQYRYVISRPVIV